MRRGHFVPAAYRILSIWQRTRQAPSLAAMEAGVRQMVDQYAGLVPLEPASHSDRVRRAEHHERRRRQKPRAACRSAMPQALLRPLIASRHWAIETMARLHGGFKQDVCSPG